MTDSRLRVFRVRALMAGAILLTLACAAAAQPQSAPPARPAGAAERAWPLTRPEATNFTETSRYDEVVAFMKAMAAASPRIHLTTYGYTFEGRPMPLAVIGAPGATPEQVLATGKTRIFIQGNIHAGEVEGKEAALWLLRSIAKGERAAWLQQRRPADQSDLQRRRQRARERAQPRQPVRSDRRHGPARAMPRTSTSTATTPSSRRPRRGRWPACSPSTTRTSRSTCTRRTAAITAST